MKKSSVKTAATELVVAGQPSAALAAELRRAGAGIDIAHIADAIIRVETARVGFVVEAVAVGILLLAKKETFLHGQWQPFCAEVWEEIRERASRTRVSDLPPAALDNFVRSLRRYCFLAQHFLADLEQNSFPREDTDIEAIPPAVQPVEVLALDTLPADKRAAVYGAIERFVAGRSLRRMLLDFRRAEDAADREEIEEAEAKRQKKKKQPPADDGQLDFLQEMMEPIGVIDGLIEDPTFRLHTDRQFWLGLAEKLQHQAARARALAKEIAE